ncbi:hypothetical protein [Mycoplana rhizolycopersici]|uniref:Uncharacterized protein n=1 Tax=Mycoplana rhizolycopersici TaxID=2746702 RepID=A0ABX2QDV0_9HYPH|nr:hypothetical protein [Rhizobium rhizolycopersici]NVP55897.1 hypothetical protein [Rhizobium rhizolycopersici]
MTSFIKDAFRAAWHSVCASFFSGMAGFVMFLFVAQLAVSYWVVDQDFFLVVVNVLPASVAIGCTSWFIQLISRSNAAIGWAMLVLAAATVLGLLTLFQKLAVERTELEYVYLFAALIPGLAMIAVHWLYFRIVNGVNQTPSRTMVDAQ